MPGYATCPAADCGKRTQAKHCRSRTCSWWRCPAGHIFDPRKRRVSS